MKSEQARGGRESGGRVVMDVVQQEAESLGKVAVPVPVAVAAQLSKSVCEGDNSNSAGHQVDSESKESELKPSRWLRVRDSLEGIAPQTRVSSSRTPLHPSVISINLPPPAQQPCDKTEKYFKSKSPVSDSVLVFKKPSSHHINFSKIFMWDPWNKIGRKSKKEKLRKKNEDKLTQLEHRNRSDGPSPILRKANGVDDEAYLSFDQLQQNLMGGEQEYAERNSKSVRFQKEVNVVYFAGDQIVEQKTEPLKKETEQQERNKELRREVCAETVSGIKFVLRKSQSEHTHAWNKK